MERKVKYPIGIQSFSEIRESGYIYVDKTQHIYNLIDTGKYYFLSRPRRFGKSLLLSTIKAYFEGRRDLFEGLAMERLESEWERYPVILLSLAGYNPSESDLMEILDSRLGRLEQDFGITPISSNPGERFGDLIRGLFKKTGKQVVILIDEYDAPIVEHLGDEGRRDEMRDLLKSVYTNLKDMDDYIRFGMLTGVSRFSKVTVFSGLNNIQDISLLDTYSEICGITETELKVNFREGIANLAAKLETDYDSALASLKENYDGYHFADESADIYNPYSLLIALKDRKIASYWFQSGTPAFLVKVLRGQKEPLREIFNEKVSEATISDIDTYGTSPQSLLFQTGYLTIKDYDPEYELYTLGIPNKEVRTGLLMELLADSTEMDKIRLDRRLREIRMAFDEGHPHDALDCIKSFLAGIPGCITQKDKELYYENNLYMLLSLLGMDIRGEWWTADGRIDLLLMTKRFIYVMELKLDSTPEAALAQIDTKDYALQWKHDGRMVIKVGINFISETRNIGTWAIKV